MKNTLLVSTRKGLVVYKRQAGAWVVEQNHFVGIPVSLAAEDERSGYWYAMLDHGHWGCKLHRSNDRGASWTELEAPKFPKGTMFNEEKEATVKYLWAFACGNVDQPGRIYIGTDPGGLFVSDDHGDTWELNKGLWNHPSRENWFGGGRDNPGIHSILVNPDDSQNLFIAISCAGVFESKDGGASWNPKNKGLRADFLPDPSSEIGQDPHILVASNADFNCMWQQNHCGIFKSTDSGSVWEDVTQENGPANFGFAIAVDATNPDKAWVVPGISDEIRVAPDLSLCVCRTEDGGTSWEKLTDGLPQANAFDITYRHALVQQQEEVIFGTTTGNLYLSGDGGNSWSALSNNLPMVYACALVG